MLPASGDCKQEVGRHRFGKIVGLVDIILYGSPGRILKQMVLTDLAGRTGVGIIGPTGAISKHHLLSG
jgi:late competence protein required for DNA uptake (superfamily II DNA/RNA helicase)